MYLHQSEDLNKGFYLTHCLVSIATNIIIYLSGNYILNYKYSEQVMREMKPIYVWLLCVVYVNLVGKNAVCIIMSSPSITCTYAHIDVSYHRRFY